MEQEVDVTLFVTCRLCLEEQGSYQIVPHIKEKIDFCFGIDVDPFDGLPQLICKGCKSTLSNYFVFKTKLLEKQAGLQRSLTLNKKYSPAEEHASREHSVVSEDATAAVAHAAAAEVARAATPSASSAPHNHSPKKRDPLGNSRRKKASWKKEYCKHYVCIICNTAYRAQKPIKKHIAMHKKITSKHEKIFKSYMTVRMNKIDSIANRTGCLQNVVYNNDTIIGDSINSNYYTFYSRKGFNEIRENKTVEKKSNTIETVELSDYSDDENIMKGKKKNINRLLSTSSTDTFVLEESREAANQNQPSNAECINVDDTSSECPTNSSALEKPRTMPQRQQAKAKVADYKAIQNIVTMCHKHYIKKIKSDDASTKPTFSESSLKHKVLSLGRKVINKQGFSCTGLLRYMEHKDLGVKWTPSVAIQNKGSNFVRIMTKLKSREDSENEDAGWKNMDVSFCRDNGVGSNVFTDGSNVFTDGSNVFTDGSNVFSDESNVFTNGLNVFTDGSNVFTDESNEFTNGSNVLSMEVLTQKKTVDGAALASLPLTPAPTLKRLLSICHDDLNNTNVLLNNPVDNPKQLSKENNNISEMKSETNSAIVGSHDAAVLVPAPVGDEFEEQVADSDMCLPIITSTKSLSREKEKQEVYVIENPPPRIKVKPASELMSERVLSNRETVNDVWAFNMSQCTLPQHLTNATGYATVPESQPSYVSSPSSGILPPDTCQNDTHLVDVPDNMAQDFVCLNCPDLPNTRTKSPFHYFKTVLLVHGLKLLDSNVDLPQYFHNLIKFHLVLEQGSKKPIKVLFSMYCYKTTFCLTFKDASSKTFDPNMLPAFWQWELLKAYNGKVVDRILQNSLKIGKEVHELTKHFLCLLKSIDLITES